MKITHLYLEGYERVGPDAGGIPSIVYRLALESAQRGHDVTIIERNEADDSGVPHDALDIRQVKTRHQPAQVEVQQSFGYGRLLLNRFRSLPSVLSEVLADDADLLHVHTPFTPNLLLKLIPSLRTKTVFTAHIGAGRKRLGIEDGIGMLKYVSPDIELMKAVSQVVVLNDDIRTDIGDHFCISGEKLNTIPNGIDVEEYGTTSQSSTYAHSDRQTVLFVGTITERKGVRTLVQSIERVLNEHSDVEFVLVGDTSVEQEYSSEIEGMIQSKGLNDRVQLAGYVDLDELRALRSEADLFVFPSYQEGSPVALAEAIASGLPIVASDIGGNRLMVEDDENGYLIAPGDDDELTARLTALLNSPDQILREMGVQSESIAKERLGWDQIVAQYHDVYDKVTNE